MATGTSNRQGRQHLGGDRPRAGRSGVGTGLVRVLMAATLLGAAQAASYHVDSRTGDDTRDGLRPDRAWRTLDRVNAASFGPGDRVLFAAGSVWRGHLRVTAQGTSDRPVVFRANGGGPRPRIEADGAFEDAVLIRNAQHVELHDLEVTNQGAGDHPRRGVNLVADNCGTLTNLLVADLFIHDVNGTQQRKNNGGILFHTEGQRVPSRYDGLRIERNVV